MSTAKRHERCGSIGAGEHVDILDILRQAQGGQAVNNLAHTFNIDRASADAALKSVVPELSQRIERNTLSRGGVADLVAAIGKASERGYLDNPQALSGDAIKSDGVGYLDQILWGKDQSRALAAKAAQSSGISEALIKQMLPTIAAMMMGGLAKGAGGGIADILSKIPGLPGSSPSTDGGGLSRTRPRGGEFGGATTGGRPLPMPGEARGGGSPATGGGFGGQSPLPIPGNARPGTGNGWGGSGSSGGGGPFDDLSDMIRRGGQSVPGTSGGGGALANIIRSVLGAVLGFQNRGVISWIIRYVVMRYGWAILHTVASIVFGRRV